MSLSQSLDRLATPGVYGSASKPRIRWGQIIRQHPSLAAEISTLEASEKLVSLGGLGLIKGGVVTRANGFFLVRELPFDQIPTRFRVTRADWRRVAVVEDGIGFLSKIEREFLKPVIKGPESLEAPFSLKQTELRLFDVKLGRAELATRHANGAIAYLRRGETVEYKTSEDDLKGGVPATRSQVRNRRPYWYSLQGEQKKTDRIVFPEHIGQRYIATLVKSSDRSVVIDKLFLFEPHDQSEARIVHASLNSLLSWYQVELRGRSQLGEGVLELKIPDYSGILLLSPSKLTSRQADRLLKLFDAIPIAASSPSLDQLGSPERFIFDLEYLKLCGFANPKETILQLEQDLRALAGERIERRLSVADSKVGRRRLTNASASVDSYATRVAATFPPHPDPRDFVANEAKLKAIPVLSPIDGSLEVGTELFNQGEVFVGGKCVARAGSVLAAQFVRGVLLRDPSLTQVSVPEQRFLEPAMSEWSAECRRWYKKLRAELARVWVGIEEPRIRASIEQRTMKLLHAL